MTNLKQIKEAVAAATEGPWEYTSYADPKGVLLNQIKDANNKFIAGEIDRDPKFYNAHFIALARTAVPALIQEIENRDRALEVAREELRIVHEEYSGRDCIELHDSLTRIAKILGEGK